MEERERKKKREKEREREKMRKKEREMRQQAVAHFPGNAERPANKKPCYPCSPRGR
jgi:hypothetical protein